MQLTRFDRWLRERFVYETYIYTISPPIRLPHGIRESPITGNTGHFKHLYVARQPEAAERFIRHLKESNQMFSTRIRDRKAWYVPWIAPADQSVTWRLAWMVILVVSSFLLFIGARSLWNDPEIRSIFAEIFQIGN